MVRYSPIILAVLLIVGLTFVEIKMTDRFQGTNITAEQQAELLAKVPTAIGDWHGDDIAVDENIKKTAGAIGAVQRNYRNVRTGEQVSLWLIVGHAREVSWHTPDICYPSQGFTARAQENSVYPMTFPGQPVANFLTNTFVLENSAGAKLVRVFWSWYNPTEKANEGQVVWEAPSNARWHFGNARALYKMYFTSQMRDTKEAADASACLRFAREFLPEVNKALSEVQGETPGGDAKAASAAAEPKTDVAKSTAADSKAVTSDDKKATESKSSPDSDNAATGVYQTGPADQAVPPVAPPK